MDFIISNNFNTETLQCTSFAPSPAAHNIIFSKMVKLKIVGQLFNITVSPKLKFYENFTPLRDQIAQILKEWGKGGAVLSRIQMKDSAGDWIDVFDSTYDPREFEAVPKLQMQVELSQALESKDLEQTQPPAILRTKSLNIKSDATKPLVLSNDKRLKSETNKAVSRVPNIVGKENIPTKKKNTCSSKLLEKTEHPAIKKPGSGLPKKVADRAVFQFNTAVKSDSADSKKNADKISASIISTHTSEWNSSTGAEWEKFEAKRAALIEAARLCILNKRKEKEARVRKIKEKSPRNECVRRANSSASPDNINSAESTSHTKLKLCPIQACLQKVSPQPHKRSGRRRSIMRAKQTANGMFPVVYLDSKDQSDCQSPNTEASLWSQHSESRLGKRNLAQRLAACNLLDGPETVFAPSSKKRRGNSPDDDLELWNCLNQDAKHSTGHFREAGHSHGEECSEDSMDHSNTSTVSSLSDISGITGDQTLAIEPNSSAVSLGCQSKSARTVLSTYTRDRRKSFKQKLQQKRDDNESGSWKQPHSKNPETNAWEKTLRSQKVMKKTDLLRAVQLYMETENKVKNKGVARTKCTHKGGCGDSNCKGWQKGGCGDSTCKGGPKGGCGDSSCKGYGSSKRSPKKLGEIDQEKMEILRQACGLDDEEIQWRIDCQRPGANAFQIAERNLEKAETHYDKWLFESSLMMQIQKEAEQISLFSKITMLEKLQQTSQDECIVPENTGLKQTEEICEPAQQLAAAISKYHLFLSDRSKMLSFDVALASLKEFCGTLESIRQEILKAKCASALGPTLVRLRNGVQDLNKLVTRTLATEGSKADHILGRIEVWRERRTNSPEYPLEMSRQEQEWAEAQITRNNDALNLMRSFIPLDIGNISVIELLECAQEKGSFFTADLALRLKNKKLLHWLVAHPDDIAVSNFLQGEHAASFTSLESYDIVELRAIYMVLPSEFLLDATGKKMEWRNSFIERLKGLVKQEMGCTVHAGWDPITKKRKEVKLAPLTEKQKRDPVYFYPSVKEMETRIAKIRDQANKIQKKREQLDVILRDIEESRKEVSDICEDARNPALQEIYGAEKLRQLRDASKQKLEGLIRRKKILENEIASAEKASRSVFPGLEHLEKELKSIQDCNLDLSLQAGGEESGEGGGLSPRCTNNLRSEERISVSGPFDPFPEIHRQELKVVKKLSAEEEVAEREKEMQQMMNQCKITSELSPVKDIAKQLDNENVIAKIKKDIHHLEEGTQAVVCSPLKQRKIGKVQIAQEVLRFLNNDFCKKSDSSTNPAPVRRSARIADSAAAEKGTKICAGLDCQQEKIAVQPKSKLLRSWEEKKKDETSRPALPMSRGPSFLAELKSKTSGSIQKEEPVGNNTCKPKLNFLEDLKARAKKLQPDLVDEVDSEQPGPGFAELVGSSKPKPNFLEELKARANSKGISGAAVEASRAHPCLAESMDKENVNPKPSFFEELKARAMSRETSNMYPREEKENALHQCSEPVGNVLVLGKPNFLEELKARGNKKGDM